MPKFSLLPTPKNLTLHSGSFNLPKLGWIILHDSPTTHDLFPAEQLAAALETETNRPWKIARGTGLEDKSEIHLRHDPEIPHDQGYRLAITPDSVELAASAPAGIFYAVQTLIQIARQNPTRWPALLIEDSPDFPRRGVYHDISRGKVPELGTILQLIDDFAHLKINEFQLYIENVFEFRRHPKMYDDTTPLTAEELNLIDLACRQRHMDFIPSLTSLGHFEKILNRPAFRKLAEAEPAELKAQGMETWSDEPWSLCVTDPKAKELLGDMYHEFLPNFTSPFFNICCDEAWDLGKGRSAELAKAIGTDQLYVDWINYCNTLAQQHGKKIMMWGDIIRNHPEKIAQLPADATMIEWGYEANHDFDTRCQVFAAAGKRFYVAPGTSSWLTLSSRTENAFANMHAAATAGLKHHAAGFLNTDWGDNGHQQLLSVSLLAFAYGAAVSWNAQATPTPTPFIIHNSSFSLFLKSISLHLFHDPSTNTADLAYELGMVYKTFGWQRFNASVDWFLFREKFDFANYVNRVTPKDLQKVILTLGKLAEKFGKIRPQHPDGDLIREEFLFTCQEIIHVCNRTFARQTWLAADPAKRNPEHDLGKLPPAPLNKKQFAATLKKLSGEAEELSETFQTLWLARNKKSRLPDILAEFTRFQKEYAKFAK